MKKPKRRSSESARPQVAALPEQQAKNLAMLRHYLLQPYIGGTAEGKASGRVRSLGATAKTFKMQTPIVYDLAREQEWKKQAQLFDSIVHDAVLAQTQQTIVDTQTGIVRIIEALIKAFGRRVHKEIEHYVQTGKTGRILSSMGIRDFLELAKTYTVMQGGPDSREEKQITISFKNAPGREPPKAVDVEYKETNNDDATKNKD